jgi:hypothetical protein
MKGKMMSLYIRRSLLWLACPILVLAVSGCTEEKALALQSAAVQYRDQAVRALTLTANGVRAATAMPAQT